MYNYAGRNVVPGEMRKLRPTALTFFKAIAFNQKFNNSLHVLLETLNVKE
jgi:hypothetical protein